MIDLRELPGAPLRKHVRPQSERSRAAVVTSVFQPVTQASA